MKDADPNEIRETIEPGGCSARSARRAEAALYMIPCGMSDASLWDVLPALNLELVRSIRHFIVENLREARRFLKRCDRGIDIDSLTMCELNRHTDISDVSGFLEPLRRGEAVGVISDAGCPAVADPGALPASIAQREGFKVIPLVGPSSILLSLMASGFNGQGFSFHGYLPIDDAERAASLRRLEADSLKMNMTQIFIETPYRNMRMLRLLSETLHTETMICVARDITSPTSEYIRSLSAGEWKRLLASGKNLPELDKRPSIFLIYAGSREAVQQGKGKVKRMNKR